MNEHNALRFARQLLSSIEYLHDNDVIHRYIKAINILNTRNVTIKGAYFGLAQRLDGVGSGHISEGTMVALREALSEKGENYTVYKGGKAFYGPKIDVKIKVLSLLSSTDGV